jgi:hypothetical protein
VLINPADVTASAANVESAEGSRLTLGFDVLFFDASTRRTDAARCLWRSVWTPFHRAGGIFASLQFSLSL